MNHLETSTRLQQIDDDPERSARSRCIDYLRDCFLACSHCAEACLRDPDGILRRCFRLTQDCADVCAVTARMLARVGEPDRFLLRRQVKSVAAASIVCGDECDQHAEDDESCRICAESCLRCAQCCYQLLAELG
jgi:hypothetical protein